MEDLKILRTDCCGGFYQGDMRSIREKPLVGIRASVHMCVASTQIAACVQLAQERVSGLARQSSSFAP